MDIQSHAAHLSTRVLALVTVVLAAATASPAAVADDPSTFGKEHRMTEAAETDRDYRFTFKAMADGEAAPGVFTYMTVMSVSGTSGRAAMVLSRHNGDLIGRPVGLFAAKLTASQTDAISNAVNATKWAELPQPTGGDVNATMLSIDYAQGVRIIQRAFNSRNIEFIRAITPVMTQVDELGSALLAKPQRAVDVALERTPNGFKFILRNVGNGPVVVADPRPANSLPESVHATIRVAEAPDQTDFAMLVWKSVSVEPLGNAAKTVNLAPGKTLEVETVAWAPSVPGNYFAQGVWNDYAGPDIDPKTAMPTFPSPEDVASDTRPYVVRGAAFSPYLKFSVDKPR